MPEEAEEPADTEVSVVTIEDLDEAGNVTFATRWPWPDGNTMLANTGFVGVFEALHDQQRKERGPMAETNYVCKCGKPARWFFRTVQVEHRHQEGPVVDLGQDSQVKQASCDDHLTEDLHAATPDIEAGAVMLRRENRDLD